MPNIYYVRSDGNNSHSGTGYDAANAWATIAKAVSMVAAGDVVRVGPGIYREIVTIATNGTLANPITWWGDKEAQYFTDMNPGYVRITGCDVNEFGQATGNIFGLNAKAYQVVRGFVIDGGKSVSATAGIYNSTTSDVYDCIIQGVAYGIRNVRSVYRCLAAASLYSFFSITNTYNSVAIGSGIGFYGAINTYNCIAVNSAYGWRQGTTVSNCTVIGCANGYINVDTTVQATTNCKAIGCQYGFYGTGANLTIVKGKAINCGVGAYGTSNVALLNVSDCKYSNCTLTQRGGEYDTGTMIEAKFEGFTDISRLLKISNSLRYDFFETGTGSTQSFTENYDIEGLNRFLGDGIIDMGCHEYSNTSVSYTEYKTYAPSVQINSIGTKRLIIPVKTGLSKTISCWVKFNLDSGIIYPSMKISSREDILTTNPIYATASGIGSVYEQLSLTFTPKATGMIYIDFNNNSNGSGGLAVSNFSDISL